MRILVNFQLYKGTWKVHCIADDARTPISSFVPVRSQDTLLRLLRYAGADDTAIAETERDIRRWGRGSAWIELAPGRKNLLQLRPPWCDSLEPHR